MSLREIATEWEVFAEEGTVGIGAVRVVNPDHLVVYIEGYGEIAVRAGQIRAAHDGKVVIDPESFDDRTRAAIAHAHDRETRP